MELLTKYYVNLSDGKEIIKENFTNWTSGNEIIDNFIQEKQLKCAANDFLFEWIPYNEFVNIKEIGDNCLTTAIWKNGPLHYHDKDSISGWIREPFKIVTLKFLYGIQNITNKSINKVESYLHDKKYFKIRGILQNPDTVKYYGISQNPDTKIYILVFNDLYLSFFCEKCGNNYGNNKWCKQCQIDQLKNNFTNWTSGNVKLDQFIQKMQLKVNEYYDVIFEWIPYNELIEIRERGDNCLTAAIWKDGPLHYDESEKKYIKNSAHKKVVLRFLYDLRNIDDEFLNLVESYLLFGYSSNYGISQDPDSEVYILVFIYNYFVYHCEKCGNKYKDSDRCCDQCQINQLKNNFTNWTSENVKLDDFIQKLQLKISRNNLVFEWIPYNEFIDIKQVEDNCFAEAIWKDGPLHYDKYKKKFIRNLSYEKVVLRFLYDSQDINDEFLNMIESYLHDNKDNKNYGISQDPDTKVYILVFTHNYFVYYCEKCGNKYKNSDEWCNQCQVDQLKSNFTNWTSGNIKLDDFIQNTQLKIDRNDVIFEWIPYSEFIDIKQMGDNCYAEAIWKDGPLYYDKYEKKYIRNSAYKKVVLRFLYDSQNISDEFLNMVGSYLINGRIYGISQNPDTKVYTLIFTYDYLAYYCRKCGNKYKDSDELCKQCQIDQLKNNFTNWTSGNVKLDDFIQKLQLNLVDDLINSLIQKLQLKLDEDFINDLIKKLKVKVIKNDMVFEWMPYNEFVDIKHIGDNCLATAIWKNGPLNYDKYEKKYIRNSTSEKVVLRFLYDSQNIDDEFLNMVGSYLLFGHYNNYGIISQDPNTIKYIKISQNLDTISYRYYGISQNPDTKVYVLIFSDKYLDYYCEKCGKNHENNKWCNQCQIDKLKNNFTKWTSGNVKLDNFIRNMQLKINENDVIFEWISYSEFIEIKKIDNEFAIAIWKCTPLTYTGKVKGSCKTVCLKYLCNKQDITDKLLNKVKSYFDNNKVYGISQNPDTKVYILVLNDEYLDKDYCEKCLNKYDNSDYYCKPCQISYFENNFSNWTSGNEKMDDFIQRNQLKISKYNDAIFEWIPYNKFTNINETENNRFATAIWEDGPLYYIVLDKKYKRKLVNEKVILKYLSNSQNTINEIIYSMEDSYGISQNPNTKDFIILVFPLKYYCENCGEKYNNQFEIDSRSCLLCQTKHKDEKIRDLIQDARLNIDYNSESNIIFEWIPYDHFDNIKEIGKGGFSTVYLAIWKDGLLYYERHEHGGEWKRKSNTKVALKCLHYSFNFLDKFINEVKAYLNQKLENILKIYGISQDPDTKDYIMILEFAEGGNFNNYLYKNYENFNWFNGLKVLANISEGLSKIHQKQMVHRDFHIGNILLMNDNYNACISDLGLCKKIDDINEKNIYGVMPYVAPEVLGGKPYTRAADIYSFGMIMYVVATGKQPFADCAHDEVLAINIYKGNRPEINEKIAPKCYIDLTKKCWDPNPDNRPNSLEIKDVIKLFYNSLDQNFQKKEQQHYEIEKQFNETQEYRKANFCSIKNDQTITHTQAIYSSRLLNPFTKNLSKYDNINNNTVEITDFTNLLEMLNNNIKEDLEKVFYWYQKAAESGDKAAESGPKEAMNNLAKCYYDGKGTEKDLKKAFYWYQKAAESGLKEAIYNLAYCNYNGKGTEKNLEKAFYWYQKAAENGLKEAMNNLADCYYDGKGTEKDLKKAFYWYQKAAESGNVEAMNNLAKCHYDGKGTEKDLKKTFYWYHKAAESGDVEAMNILVYCYYNGEGTEKDFGKSLFLVSESSGKW
ncbi:hypothetical protein RclHR1_01020001 [Rhizophagus clarus]|uniref:Protein kinase domain-containing protein n=2 Tax=Rhizophagus clarus TaxID=94130 RepID=A0A2Z6Q0X5_9GLOM|nr:hypothetical protein RclHR1_01020001 [Rhizophagus clarus]